MRHSTTDKHDVGAGEQPFAVAGEVQRLQAEGGERRVAAADPGHDELAGVAADEKAAVRPGQRGEEADDEAAGDVDDQRAYRERPAEGVRGEAREPIARHAAQCAAEHDPEPSHLVPKSARGEERDIRAFGPGAQPAPFQSVAGPLAFVRVRGQRRRAIPCGNAPAHD